MTAENKTRQFNFVVVCEVSDIDGVEHREYWLDGDRTHVFLNDYQVYEYDKDGNSYTRIVMPSEYKLCSDIQEVVEQMLNDQNKWEKEK